MRKGQVSLEFMFSVGVLLLLIITISIIITEQNKAASARRDDAADKADCLALASAIVNVYTHPGSVVNLTLVHPATVSPRVKVVDVGGAICTIPVDSVSGSGSFNLTEGKVFVSSSYGENNVFVRN